MRVLVVFLAFFVAAMSAESRLRERRFLFNRCSQESDCGAGKCCLLGRYCTPKLPKYSTCHLTGVHKCGCQDGLGCRVTKEFSVLGQKFSLRQCMPIEESNDVEQLKDEDVEDIVEGNRKKRFLVDRCTQESDCGENRCCLFGKFCAREIPKYFTCYLTHKHKCGCQDGLQCQVTSTIVIPLIGTKIPIRQCVPASPSPSA